MTELPHKIAVLCYLYDPAGRVLLLHRRQMPNAGMYSPIGGKLHEAEGEGPHECALREIAEEIGVTLTYDDIHLTGIVTERAYEHQTHWMMFLFEVTRPVSPDELKWTEFKEGVLEWISPEDVPGLDIPVTDREVMWPLVQRHRGGGFFMAHIDWGPEELSWRLVESTERDA